MHFRSTPIQDLWIIEPERAFDRRGSFARTYCKETFKEHGLHSEFVQHSLSVSQCKHTLRGLHFQAPPHQEIKLVSCVRGEVWDVAVDLRPNSPTYLVWFSAMLSADRGTQFYIPQGCAHGFLSLCEDAAISYLISTPYVPNSSSGLRYDDPAIGIVWPHEPAVISDRDLEWPYWRGLSNFSVEEAEI
ncbi:dTDP-4-dehydrorhamnose 3,5-epimerase [Rhizobium sp. FKY42]|uniref:dTDP-4-dehydrorhamnose 3,5-epimerase n=1 Tax=Rhizobium sp. FKY42 TaxID=2562310 RepID=UPI0010BF8FCA|nr:dTDP-4-dehydrorhamnose 3,5-epimerase [Rhizobium sp. FKY42]